MTRLNPFSAPVMYTRIFDVVIGANKNCRHTRLLPVIAAPGTEIQFVPFQYWNGTNWISVPGAAITGKSLVWRQFLFAPITTSKIRVYITGALNGFSRVMEVEAWGNQ